MSETSRRALLVEDDLFFSARILSVLRNLGYHPDTASTPDQAIQTARSISPLVALVNLSSVRLGGPDLIRRLKEEAGVPFVIAYLSHIRIPEMRSEARAAGVDRLCANSAIIKRLPDILASVLNGEGGNVTDIEDE